ncbi:MAG: cysteine desulfurase [Lachnospiraceae bacterium]|nr:cysteine desulfurase [Lachnospiraceae bacterium]
MQVYLDNSATTRPFDDVREMMREIEAENYGNPSSLHMMGVRSEQELRHAREILAGLLKVKEKEICFTSGGTESDNLALIGCARANKRSGQHLITTKIEHPAVLETMKFLETEGYEVTYLDVDANGCVQTDTLQNALRKDTILVSVMHVNNEIGSLQQIRELSAAAKAFNPAILFHVDAVQSFGKYRIYPKRWGIDLLSVSAHKIHGPKGTGFLYADEKVKMQPVLFGGGQQGGRRSGTENVPAIAGMARAAEEIYEDFENKIERLYTLKTGFIEELERLDQVRVNAIPVGDEELSVRVKKSAPHIVSASVGGIRAEVLLHALEEKGIYVSSGSACASNKPALSKTLMAIGVERTLLDSTIRFSFSMETTKEELDYTIEALRELLPALRRYTRH